MEGEKREDWKWENQQLVTASAAQQSHGDHNARFDNISGHQPDGPNLKNGAI